MTGDEKRTADKAGTVVTFPDQDTIEAEAGTWIIRLDKGDLSPQERQAFDTWLNKSDQHRETFERLSGLWSTLDQLGDLKSMNEIEFIKPNFWERIGFEARHRVIGAFATAAVLLLIVLPTGPFVSSDKDYLQAHRTLIGGQKTVNLPDGSVLLLNTDSHVDISFSKKARTVHLNQGEVHFTVASDKSRPFSVYADNRVVTAVGTAFTVRRRPKDIEVTVTNGDVDLYLMPQTPTSIPEITADQTRQTLASLTAGEIAVFGEEIEYQEIVPEQELNRKLAWRQGLLAFAGEPLSDVIAEVSRYTDIEIVINDPSVNELRFGGFFKVGNVEALFDALEQSFGVDVNRIDETTVLLSKATL